MKYLTALGGISLLSPEPGAHAFDPSLTQSESFGVLVDTTLCIGCRNCEEACNHINQDLPRRPANYFEDYAVFEQKRRMDGGAYTVVNRYSIPDNRGKPVYAKFQCMHCISPACMSACIVGAFRKEPNGAVTYDAWKCIGCRYCMAACPFQVPGYEYHNAFTPQVRKCTFCFKERLLPGNVPACIQACPTQVMTFGKRSDMIALARERIREFPLRYLPHLYGEHEVGGTSWLYLSSVPFQAIGLPRLGYVAIPQYTEPIQHAVFKYFIPPAALYGLLGGIMWFTRPKEQKPKPLFPRKGMDA